VEAWPLEVPVCVPVVEFGWLFVRLDCPLFEADWVLFEPDCPLFEPDWVLFEPDWPLFEPDWLLDWAPGALVFAAVCWAPLLSFASSLDLESDELDFWLCEPLLDPLVPDCC
jgi:hypothetical protein